MSEPTRVVLAGCGGIAGAWLKPIKERDDIVIVGCMDLNEEAARKRKTEFELNEAVVGTDLEAMLSELKPDAVFDCTTPEAHVKVTLPALAHGCHVLGEKPLADSMENARKMVQAAQDAGKIYAVIQNRRYLQNIRTMRKFLAEGRIGQLTTVNADFYIGAHFGGFRDRMEHVLLLDMAIHSFDQARFLTGASPEAVYCHEWNPAGSWYDHDASAVAIFEMSDGLVLNYRGSWCAEGLNTSWECEWRFIGTQGSARWDGRDLLEADVLVKNEGFSSQFEHVTIPIEDDGTVAGHGGVIDDFMRAIREGGTPDTICTDNIQSLAMVFGAIASAEQGERVAISV